MTKIPRIATTSPKMTMVSGRTMKIIAFPKRDWGSDSGGSDIFLGHTGTKSGESDSQSSSDSDESDSNSFCHLITPL